VPVERSNVAPAGGGGSAGTLEIDQLSASPSESVALAVKEKATDADAE